MNEDLIRKDIRNLTVHRYEGPKECRVFLDSNESPFDIPQDLKEELFRLLLDKTELNRYPNSEATFLREIMSSVFAVESDEIVVGVGSNELITIIINTFVESDEKVICPNPSFNIYKLISIIERCKPVEFIVRKEDDFNLDIDSLIELTKTVCAKVVFISSPNNPTGNIVSRPDIIEVLKRCQNSIIVVDEAYFDFTDNNTVIDLINQFENLIVLRTFSKAYGLAGIRCGFSASNKDIANQLFKVKPPFNVSSLTQNIAMFILNNLEIIDLNVTKIKEQREYLFSEMSKLNSIKLFSTEANFIFFEVSDGGYIHKELIKKGIHIRSFGDSKLIRNCLRVTVGHEWENKMFLDALRLCLNHG